MKHILEKTNVCCSIATICLIQGTSWLLLASKVISYCATILQADTTPIYSRKHGRPIYVEKNSASSKLYLSLGILCSQQKGYQNPKGGALHYFHVHKSRNYSWDPPLDLALISRSLIRSLSTELDCSHSLSAIGESAPVLSTELDCSHSLSEIGESTPGLASGPRDRFKGCTCAGVGWDSKGGRFKQSLTAGFRRTERWIFFNQLRNIDHKIGRDHEPKSGKWHTSTVNKWEKVWCDPVKENCLSKKWRINGSTNVNCGVIVPQVIKAKHIWHETNNRFWIALSISINLLASENNKHNRHY
jgi:hypothetical protein